MNFKVFSISNTQEDVRYVSRSGKDHTIGLKKYRVTELDTEFSSCLYVKRKALKK